SAGRKRRTSKTTMSSFSNSMTMKLTRRCSSCLRMMLAKALWLLTLALGSSTLHAADNTEATRPLRLGIPEFVTSGDVASLRGEGARLVDLLTARLSREAGFELVERAALDRVLRETSLSVSGMARPEQAVRVGKLVRAD